jgi:ABC-type proline/glycine betaine transport system permease subunit
VATTAFGGGPILTGWTFAVALCGASFFSAVSFGFGASFFGFSSTVGAFFATFFSTLALVLVAFAFVFGIGPPLGFYFVLTEVHNTVCPPLLIHCGL